MNEEPRDHVSDDDDPDAGVEDNIKSKSTWMRLLYIVIFSILYGVSRIVVLVVVAMQFFWLLFTGQVNERLSATGQSLATYTYQLVRYLTFNTDERPFPFDDDWPSTKPLE